MATFSAKDSTGAPQTLSLADVTAAGSPSSTGLFTVQGNPSGTPIPVAIASGGSTTLPTGAATSAAQATQQTSLSSIDGKVATSAKQDTMQTSLGSIDSKLGPLTAIGSPSSTATTVQVAGTVNIAGGGTLPTGASTSALQTTGNNSLASIDGKITAVNTNAVTVSSVTPPGTPVGGNLTVGTTAAAGPTLTLTSGAVYKADDDNTDSIYIGVSSSVSSTKTNANTMHRLKAGQSVYLPANNSNKYFFVGGAAAQTLYILGA